MPTPYFNLPLYTGTDTAELDVLLNGQSSALDAALLANVWKFAGTDAQRVALAAPYLREGIDFYATDTNRKWFYDGAAWQSNDPGLNLLRPGSVSGTGITVDPDGTIQLGGSTGYVDIRNIFSARFANYKVIMKLVQSVAGVPQARMLNGTTPYSGASDYVRTVAWSASPSTWTSSSGTASNTLVISPISTTVFRIDMDWLDPTSATDVTTIMTHINAGGQQVIGTHYAGSARVDDGFALTPNAGSLSGYIKVYGYA